MRNPLVRVLLALKATRELGLAQSFWYGVYQVGLRSGYYRFATPLGQVQPVRFKIHSPFHLPDPDQLRSLLGPLAAGIIADADEIVSGKVRLFGGPPVALELAPEKADRHWSKAESLPAGEDIKFTWEPARFGWAYTLGRAYRLTGNERYPETFWSCFEAFLRANPTNHGPNWSSAQEVALRLIALLFASTAFAGSAHGTRNRQAMLAGAVAAHAERIPPTILYARAQNNNHLISEALGLYLAGSSLPDHPRAAAWRSTGWRWLNRAFQTQILADGTYSQHSMNYHRLMLHAALQGLLPGSDYPLASRKKLAAATAWLLAQVDPLSGRAPNLGSNDGALILPLAPGGPGDYRPVAQTAARAFLDRPAFPPGPWDETCLWLGLPVEIGDPLSPVPSLPESPAVHHLGNQESWATLRAVHFEGRPAHADQLHVDLWWRGENIALDAGTYRYTALPPWDNALAFTLVHNTVEVNGQNQMLRAGRFLWLDWAQAKLVDTHSYPSDVLAAQHDGYQHMGLLHRRVLRRDGPQRWHVTDQMRDAPTRRLDVHRGAAYTFRLHWLLPDWPWQLDGSTITLRHPAGGSFSLALSSMTGGQPAREAEIVSLVRAGKALVGPENVPPVLGWYSPTYNTRLPALSFSLIVVSPLPCDLFSEWVLG
jgi:hypothetical protein